VQRGPAFFINENRPKEESKIMEESELKQKKKTKRGRKEQKKKDIMGIEGGRKGTGKKKDEA